MTDPKVKEAVAELSALLVRVPAGLRADWEVHEDTTTGVYEIRTSLDGDVDGDTGQHLVVGGELVAIMADVLGEYDCAALIVAAVNALPDFLTLISDRDRLEGDYQSAVRLAELGDELLNECVAARDAAEAKLTALVEALERIKGLSWCDPRPELEASYAQQAIAVAQSIASQALAHHSAPVGSQEAPRSKQPSVDVSDPVALAEAVERIRAGASDAPVPAPVPAEEGGGWTGRPISADQAEAYDAYRDMQRDQAEAPAQAPQDVAGLVEGGWLPIVLCPTDGADRLVRLSDGREVVACFDGGFLGRRRWTIRTVAYHNPARIIGQRGGVDQWSTPYDTYLISDLPDGVMPTHFRPNDTVYGATTPRPGEDDDGPVAQQGQPEIAALPTGEPE